MNPTEEYKTDFMNWIELEHPEMMQNPSALACAELGWTARERLMPKPKVIVVQVEVEKENAMAKR